MPRAHSCPASFSQARKGFPRPRVYAIYIPTKDNSGRRIRQSVLDDLESRIAENFSGSTTFRGNGCYFSEEDSRMKCEPVLKVEATRTYGLGSRDACEEWEADDRFMDGLAEEIGQMLGQEGVFGITHETDTLYVAGPKLSFARRDLIEYEDLQI